MRYLFIPLLLFCLLNATESTENEKSNKKQKVTLGAGPYIQTQPYKKSADLFLPSPVIFFDNSLFYIRWSRAGVYFLGEATDEYAWGLSLTLQPRPYGYEASDSIDLRGMKTREKTLEGGIALSASYGESFGEIMLLTDLLDRYDSWLLRAEFGRSFAFGDFTLYPTMIFNYLSDDFVNYYYGVNQNEADATLSRTPYRANAGWQIGAQTFINYKINKNYALLLNIRADRLPSSATASPIVDDNYIYSGLLSLMYSFEY